jgi:hypothetical protein
MGGAAAILLHARRPYSPEDVDTPEFAHGLDHWAATAWLGCGSPREMKRFLNHLRFAAAGSSRLAGGVLVGLGVLALADLEMVRGFAERGEDWLARVRERGESAPIWGAILEAREPEALVRSALPAFQPTREEAAAFLALWEGVRVRG